MQQAGNGDSQSATPRPPLFRVLLAMCLTAVVSSVVILWLAGVVEHELAAVARTGPASPDEAITLVAAVLAVAGAAWLGVAVVISLAAHVPGPLGAAARGLRDRWSPAVARRAAAFLLGVTIGGGLAPGTAVAAPGGSQTVATTPAGAMGGAVDAAMGGQASAHELPPPGFGPGPATDADVTAGSDAPPSIGWTPTRPPVRQAPAALLAPSLRLDRAAHDEERVVVVRGDTLWSLASEALGRGATDAEVAEAVTRWHDVNRDVIGNDPDLILPGQQLRVPDLAPTR